jgi:hypothetical protein
MITLEKIKQQINDNKNLTSIKLETWIISDWDKNDYFPYGGELCKKYDIEPFKYYELRDIPSKHCSELNRILGTRRFGVKKSMILHIIDKSLPPEKSLVGLYQLDKSGEIFGENNV